MLAGDLSLVRWQTSYPTPCYGACLLGIIKQQSMLTYCRYGQCIIVICISAMRSLGWWSLVGCWCVLKWDFFLSLSFFPSHMHACGLISWPFSCLSLYHSFLTAKMEHLLYVCPQPFKLLCCHSGFCCYEAYTVFKALGRLSLQKSEKKNHINSSSWLMKL